MTLTHSLSFNFLISRLIFWTKIWWQFLFELVAASVVCQKRERGKGTGILNFTATSLEGNVIYSIWIYC